MLFEGLLRLPNLEKSYDGYSSETVFRCLHDGSLQRRTPQERLPCSSASTAFPGAGIAGGTLGPDGDPGRDRSAALKNPAVCGLERGLNFCVRQIRKALEEDAKRPRFLETLRGR